MESVVKKLFLSGCLVVGLAVSLTSFATYAADEPTASETTSFKLTVLNPLTLSDVKANTITANPGGAVATGTLSATVQSGSKYTLSLSAAEPDLSPSKGGSDKIVASNGLTAANSWGIKMKTGAADDANAEAYTAITPTSTVFYTSAAAAETEAITNFEIGVKTTKTLPADTYSTTVTVTAATTN